VYEKQTAKERYWIQGGDQMARNSNSNQILVNDAQNALDRMKYEIASEFGVNLGGETPSRLNGSVGVEMTKRMVAFVEQTLSQTLASGMNNTNGMRRF
jgi:small acid-soluble spore protein B (major beta-type SASP)